MIPPSIMSRMARSAARTRGDVAVTLALLSVVASPVVLIYVALRLIAWAYGLPWGAT